MAASGPSYTKFSRLSKAKANEYTLVDSYKLGYRNREDITNLPPGVLIVGSQNVLHNASNRIQIRQGYTVDGATSVVAAAILGSYDFTTFAGTEEHLRAGFNTDNTDGKLQFRYIDVNGNPQWQDLLTGLTSTKFRFTNFWDTLESKQLALGVNGTPNFYEWNGAHSTVVSTSNDSGNILTFQPTPTAGGSGYSVNDILTVTGGTNGQFKVTQIGSSPVTGAIVNQAGSGYQVGDLLNIEGAGSGCVLEVASVSGSGIATLSISNGGTGYVSATNIQASGNGSTGLGHGATIDITVSSTTGIVTAIDLISAGSGYSTGSGQTTTSAHGTGATVEISAVTEYTITVANDIAAFYQSRNMNLVINGVTYTYTGLYGNSFIGINTDPTLAGINPGDIIYQAVVVTPNSGTGVFIYTFLIILLLLR